MSKTRAVRRLLHALKNYRYHYYCIVTAKGFIQCRKSDPYLDECLRGAFQSTIPHLVKGKNTNEHDDLSFTRV